MGWSEDLLMDPSAVVPELECLICMELMKDSVMGECQHTLCQDCLAKVDSMCPQCRLKIHKPVPNRLARSMIDRFKIRCSHVAEGCDVVCEIGTRESHKKDCGYEPVVCDNNGCGSSVLRKDYAAHRAQCSFTLVSCEQCKVALSPRDKEAHNCVASLLAKVEALTTEVACLKQRTDEQDKIVTAQADILRRLEALERAKPAPAPVPGACAPSAASAPYTSPFEYPNFGRWTLKKLSNGDLTMINGQKKVSLQFVKDSNGWFRITQNDKEVTVYSHNKTSRPAEVPAGDERPYNIPTDKHKPTYKIFSNTNGGLYIYTHYGLSDELVVIFPNKDDVIFRNINLEVSLI